MQEPRMKSKIGIDVSFPSTRSIYFWATQDAAEYLKRFGALRGFDDGSSRYHIEVDARYDFAEVLTYIESVNATE